MLSAPLTDKFPSQQEFKGGIFHTARWPLAPSATLCNMTTCLQQQTEWISNCIHYLRDKAHHVIEPLAETEEQWVQHHDETANATLISRTDSWYMGSNIPGKPRCMLFYCGGVGTYEAKRDDVANREYEGFAMQ